MDIICFRESTHISNFYIIIQKLIQVRISDYKVVFIYLIIQRFECKNKFKSTCHNTICF